MSFTYINEDRIDPELKCGICDDPFQSPVNCVKCGHTYCESCISKWRERQLSCPSCRDVGDNFRPVITRVIHNQLNRLLVQCTLCQRMDIQRTNFTDHISLTCPKYIVPCRNNCGWTGFREYQERHFIECQRRFEERNISLPWSKVVAVVLAIVFWFVLR